VKERESNKVSTKCIPFNLSTTHFDSHINSHSKTDLNEEIFEFKSKPVPKNIFDKNKLEKLESERKERITLYKELYATKNKMKLFSFIDKYDDKDKTEKLKLKYEENNKIINFKAKKVPDFIKEQIYNKIIEDKNSMRKENIEKRKE